MEEEVTESKMMHRGGQCVQRLGKAELLTAFAGIEGEVCGKMRGQWQEDRGWRRADGPGRQHPPSPCWTVLHPTQKWSSLRFC